MKWIRSSILSQCKELNIGTMCLVYEFQLLHERESFAVAGDEKAAFLVG